MNLDELTEILKRLGGADVYYKDTLWVARIWDSDSNSEYIGFGDTPIEAIIALAKEYDDGR